tara:strand:- start:8554 stop:9090 length:537 start_codon:yes stop_codon:yes gene_type:complete
MANYSDLPNEIITKIYEYNPCHRPLYERCMRRIPFKQVLEQIPNSGIKMRLNIINSIFDRQIWKDGNWDKETLMRKNIDDPEHVLKILGQCYCCKRHCQKRPNTLIGLNLKRRMRLSYHRNCTCACRHNARFIYRCFNKTLMRNDRYSKKWALDHIGNILERSDSDSDSDTDYLEEEL